MSEEQEARRLDAEDLLPADALENRLLVLPTSRLDYDVYVYDERMIDFVKQLRADGLGVDWASDKERRSFDARRSAVEVIFNISFALATGVGANMLWDGVIALLARKPRASTPVHLEIIRETRADGTRREWLTYDGTGAEVAKLMQRDSPPSDQQ
jgi:hypothetical protein